jgi:hypothetical protein
MFEYFSAKAVGPILLSMPTLGSTLKPWDRAKALSPELFFSAKLDQERA